MTAQETRTKNIATGARLRTPPLLEQADVSIKLAKDDAAAFGPRFPDARRSEMEAVASRARELFSDQSVAKTDVPQASVATAQTFRTAKDLVSDCLSAATNAFEDESPEILEAFRAGAKIGQSPLVSFAEFRKRRSTRRQIAQHDVQPYAIDAHGRKPLQQPIGIGIEFGIPERVAENREIGIDEPQ